MDLKTRSAEMREFFNEKASGYDNVHASLMQTKHALIDALPDGVRTALDLGAGTGLELIRFFERYPDARVTTIDIAEETVPYLLARPFADRIDARVGDFFTAEPGTDFDAVISTSSLHHFLYSDKLTLYRRIFSFLRPGGAFINADEIARDDAEEAQRLLEYEQKLHRHGDTPLTWAHERELLEQAGFVGIRMTPIPDTIYGVMEAYRPE